MFPTYFTWSHAEPVSTTQEVRENQIGVYLATSGNLTVIDRGGNTVVYNSLPAGAHAMLVRQVTVAPANSLVLYE